MNSSYNDEPVRGQISRRSLLGQLAWGAVAAATGWAALSQSGRSASAAATAGTGEVVHTDAQWRKLLTPLQYSILRQSWTEPAFHNAYWNNHAAGTYVCAGCDNLLYRSSTKFDSGTGWPSFWAPATKSSVVTDEDDSFGMQRTEVRCARCRGHVGHLFHDGPPPTGLRYCMNSGAMLFVPAKKA